MSGGIPRSSLLPYKLLSGNLGTQIPNGGWYLQPTIHCTHTMFSYIHFLYKGDLARLWITLSILGCRVHAGSSYCHVELSPSAICALHFTCKSPHNIMTSSGTVQDQLHTCYQIASIYMYLGCIHSRTGTELYPIMINISHNFNLQIVVTALSWATICRSVAFQITFSQTGIRLIVVSCMHC